MSYEFLQTLWFILIAVLWIGFYFLEGFDFGVGMLIPVLGKKDEERRAIINTIGSVWDGNEVWLLTAGGATLAAFPHWYATMFSGFHTRRALSAGPNVASSASRTVDISSTAVVISWTSSSDSTFSAPASNAASNIASAPAAAMG